MSCQLYANDELIFDSDWADPDYQLKDSIVKIREAYERGLYSANECREYCRKYIAPSPIPYAPFTKPLNPKTELDKLIEKARWENEHSWFYRLFHRWKE